MSPGDRRLTVFFATSLLAFVALSAFAQAPSWVEALYVRGIGPVLAGIPNLVTRALPFSLAELVIVAAVGSALLATGWGVRQWWRGARPTGRDALRAGIFVVALGLTVADAFSLVWGLSYARPSVETRWGWEGDLDDIPPAELASLARVLVDAVNERYLLLHRAPDGFVPTRLTADWSTVDAAVERGFVALQASRGVPEDADLARSRGPAKGLLLSTVTSWLRIGGFYFPFTAEANVNRQPPDWQQAFTTAHEKAHQRFVASEDEANFYGFLACIHSDDAFVQYGGYLFAQRQVLRALQDTDPIAFADQIQRRLPGVQRDVNDAHAFWTGFRSPVGDVSRAVNDAYLRANGVEGGVRSYGRSLQLVARYARERRGRWPAGPVVEEM